MEYYENKKIYKPSQEFVVSYFLWMFDGDSYHTTENVRIPIYLDDEVPRSDGEITLLLKQTIEEQHKYNSHPNGCEVTIYNWWLL